MKHQLIDFDEKLTEHLQDWITAHRDEYAKPDDMEADAPEETLRWLNAPADWLDGATPGTYFEQFSDAENLTGWMEEYMRADVSVPGPLLDRIAMLGEPAPLMAILDSRMAGTVKAEDAELVMTCISLLNQMDTDAPAGLYIDYMVANGEDEVSEAAAEALAEMPAARDKLIEALPQEMSEASRTAILDALVHLEPHPAVYDQLIRMFTETEDRKALYASYLGKYGDPRAVDVLLQAITEPELNYLEFLEIRNAIEELGGECTVERTFDGDKYYESMKSM